MFKAPKKIADVFKTIGQPTITYVEREQGHYEKLLSDAIDSNGQLCLITGASKTGKTTLYKRVLQQKKKKPIVVRCDQDLTSTEFWKKSLEQINAERISQTSEQTGSEVSGKLGLADFLGIFKSEFGATAKHNDSEIRERILSNPSPEHLMVFLKKLPLTLVVEDFHYLKDEVKIVIFQQWKNFIDNEISVLVLGTTHRAVDIANSNKDLIGRIAQINTSRWNNYDLSKIMFMGFEHLGANLDQDISTFIARESVGLPIITQQACLQMFLDKNISVDREIAKETKFTKADAAEALHNVARRNYAQLDHAYNIITKGPRQRARKYNTYEMVMLSFAQDPLRFKLSRVELDKRLSKLGVDKPPPGSVTSTLSALGKFQSKNEMALLEWIAREKMLYMLEPSFLFYVRWRQKRPSEDGRTAFVIMSFDTILDRAVEIQSSWKNLLQKELFYFNKE